MGKIWLVEIGDYAEIDMQYAFATEELANEFSSRPHSGRRAWVRELDILTELPPIEEQEPVVPYILTLSPDGTSRIITDPEEIEKTRAEMIASIHSWGGPISPFSCGTDEIQECPVYMVQWCLSPVSEKMNWQMGLPPVKIRPSSLRDGCLKTETSCANGEYRARCQVQSVIGFDHAWQTAKKLLEDFAGETLELPEYHDATTNREVANV